MSPPSFAELYREWSPYVYSLSYRLAGNKADAEDVAQETFLRVHRFLKDYKGGSFKGWLYKIVTNTFYLMLEKEKKKPVPMEDKLLEQGAGITATVPPEEAVEKREARREIHRMVSSLPADYKTAMVLADLEDLSYQEISEILGIPVGTVRSRIARARGLLKTKLIAKGGKDRA